MPEIKNVCVYCGSNAGNDPAFIATARELGQALADAGLGLVYGGGATGLMGEVASAALAAGGDVTGIIPQFLVDREKAHPDVKNLIVTKDMHERKWAMFEQSDAFVALPGGIGTLEELIEILTWAQLGRHHKPIVIADINGFWHHLSDLLTNMSDAGFLHSLENFQPVFVSSAAEIVPTILGK